MVKKTSFIINIYLANHELKVWKTAHIMDSKPTNLKNKRM